MRRRTSLAYFDNDAKVRAPFDALGLMQRLGLAKPMIGYDAAAGDIVAMPRDRRRSLRNSAHSSARACG